MNSVTRNTLTLLFIFLLGCQITTAKAPSRIHRIDFTNFTYHQFWGRRPIRLKQGLQEFDSPGCHTKYTLKGVTYVDLTRDRKEEALVHIQDYTVCGSSGISDYYYIYTLRNSRRRLLWRFGTGGYADAGLKDFKLDGRVLVFELFGKYKIVGPKFVSLGEDSIGKWDPKHYSRIRVSWDGTRFRQQSLEVLPFPYDSISPTSYRIVRAMVWPTPGSLSSRSRRANAKR